MNAVFPTVNRHNALVKSQNILIVEDIDNNQKNESDIKSQLFYFRLINLFENQKDNYIFEDIVYFKQVIYSILLKIQKEACQDDANKNKEVPNIS